MQDLETAAAAGLYLENVNAHTCMEYQITYNNIIY